MEIVQNLLASVLYKKSIKKTRKKVCFVQFISFSIVSKTRKLCALLTDSSKKQQCEDRSI